MYVHVHINMRISLYLSLSLSLSLYIYIYVYWWRRGGKGGAGMSGQAEDLLGIGMGPTVFVIAYHMIYYIVLHYCIASMTY